MAWKGRGGSGGEEVERGKGGIMRVEKVGI